MPSVEAQVGAFRLGKLLFGVHGRAFAGVEARVTHVVDRVAVAVDYGDVVVMDVVGV